MAKKILTGISPKATNASSMIEYTLKPLGLDTWDAYARLIERHNGIWGGCWRTWFHRSVTEKRENTEGNCALKERLVKEGKAHAALVFDDDVAVGWCQYGPPGELPNIHHRKEYEAGLSKLPDYLHFRGQGVPAQRGVRGCTARCAEANRRGRRWCRGGVSTRPQREESLGLIPLQRHSEALRTGWLHLPAAQGPGQLRDEQDGCAALICKSA
jgi:hypothetical protein